MDLERCVRETRLTPLKESVFVRRLYACLWWRRCVDLTPLLFHECELEKAQCNTQRRIKVMRKGPCGESSHMQKSVSILVRNRLTVIFKLKGKFTKKSSLCHSKLSF